MQIKRSLVIALVASSFATPIALASDSSAASASDMTMITTVNGRPPFNRQRVSKADASLARFEETEPAARTSTVNFRGAPPFRRNVSTASASQDFARFEETNGDAVKPRRSGPPGKNVSRRHR